MNPSRGRRSFTLRIAVEARAPVILKFHKDRLTPYLWPRDLDYFRALAEQESIYEVIETTDGADRLVGMCYVTDGDEPDTNTPRFEFGGIYVEEDCRGHGLATALGMVAISSHSAWNYRTDRRLIAHVHEKNNDPRGMLEGPLGFVRNGQEIPPAHLVPKSMERNDDGDVVGHLFEFKRPQLEKFADWIDKFMDEIEGKAGKSDLERF